MRKLDKYLNHRKIIDSRLKEYGFKDIDGKKEYSINVLNDEFKVVITVENNTVYSKIIDLVADEEYALVDVEEAEGEYIGRVKEAYKNVIEDFINNCTQTEIFNGITREVIKYVTQKYGDTLEFLWDKFQTDAIWRNKKNKKWYALLMCIKEDRLGIESEREVEVINVMYEKGKTSEVIDNIGIFPGYHMNKNSWITIKLDGTVELDKIFSLIDNSYNLALSKKG